MSKYLQKKFALSEQGGRDLTKAIFSCAITNMGLIFPMGILFLFMERLLGPLVGLQAPSLGMAGYVAVCIVLLVIIFIFWRIQYDATFVASYTESANMRIRLAERLRTLPMSFFGKRDLADLTTTIMADSAFIEKAFSHFIPELIGAFISTALIGVCLLAADWRMGLAVLWVVPVSFLLAAGTRPMVDRVERRQKEKKIAASDGIQECIENIQDIKANNLQEEYLRGLDQKILNVESITIRPDVPESRHGYHSTGRSCSSVIPFHRLYAVPHVYGGVHQAVRTSYRLSAEPVGCVLCLTGGGTDERD